MRPVAIFISASAIFITAWAQDLPRDLKAWTLEYSVSGGMAGLHRRAKLSDSGEFSSENRGSRAAGRAPEGLMAKVKKWLNTAHAVKPKNDPPMPDAIYSSTTVTAEGHKYTVELPAEIARELNAEIAKQLQSALLGHWRQSGWKLCTPVSHMEASQLDPPIDDLEFRADGRFAITWRGGGAHTTDLPHAFQPDYSGRYQFEPDYAHVSLTREAGIFSPKDFAGNGNIILQPDQLILEHIWFGTRQAKRKPDICELSFVPLQSGPVH